MADGPEAEFLDGLPFVYPDPLSDITYIDGAAFLYFSGLTLPLPVQPVSDYSEWGAELFDIVAERRPSWAEAFFALWEIWQTEIRNVNRVMRILSPLRDRFKNVMLAYPADQEALDRSRTLVRDANYSTQRMLAEVVTPGGAAGELMKHIILEEWLFRDQDLGKLYEYCNTIFTSDRIPDMLAEAYLFRCTPLRYDIKMTILLNNERLVPFLDHLRSGLDIPASAENIPRDTVTWELFRQILTPYLDPITDITAAKIAGCLDERPDEIAALKNQCGRLSDRLMELPDLERMKTEVARHIDLYVKDDLANLLSISDATRRDIAQRVLSDKVAWAGTLSFIYGSMHAMPTISVAGAIGALAFIGSSVSRSVTEYRKILRTSD